MSLTRAKICGLIYAVLSTIFWGTVFIAARFLLSDGNSKIDPYTLVFLRYSFGASFIFIWALLTKRKLSPGPWPRVRKIIKATFFLYWLMTVCFFIGQQHMTATTTSLFVESGPAFLLVLWHILTGRKATAGEIVSSLCGLLGCMLVLNIISPDGIHFSGSLVGMAFGTMAAVSWVIGSYFAQDVMETGDCIVTTAWCQLFAALMSLPLMGIMHDRLCIPADPVCWIAIAALGLFPTAIAFVTWSKAMVLLPLVELNLTQNLTPVFTMVGAWLLIGEEITGWNIFGMAIVFLGLSASAFCKDSGNDKKT